jgi:hypothetical protein
MIEKKRGRPREYGSAAERQRAYRQRAAAGEVRGREPLSEASAETLRYIIAHGPVDRCFLDGRKTRGLFQRGAIVMTEQGWIAAPGASDLLWWKEAR